MTRDDMIRMARESGFEFNLLGGTFTNGKLDEHLANFAAMVAAAEREECAKMCDALGRWTQPTAKRTVDTRHDALEEAAAAIRARGQHD